MLVMRVVELLLITIITVLLIRARGEKLQTSVCSGWFTQSGCSELKCSSVRYFPGTPPGADTVSRREKLNPTIPPCWICQCESLCVFHRWIMAMKTWWRMKTSGTLLPLSDSTNQQLPNQILRNRRCYCSSIASCLKTFITVNVCALCANGFYASPTSFTKVHCEFSQRCYSRQDLSFLSFSTSSSKLTGIFLACARGALVLVLLADVLTATQS